MPTLTTLPTLCYCKTLNSYCWKVHNAHFKLALPISEKRGRPSSTDLFLQYRKEVVLLAPLDLPLWIYIGGSRKCLRNLLMEQFCSNFEYCFAKFRNRTLSDMLAEEIFWQSLDKVEIKEKQLNVNITKTQKHDSSTVITSKLDEINGLFQCKIYSNIRFLDAFSRF